MFILSCLSVFVPKQSEALAIPGVSYAIKQAYKDAKEKGTKAPTHSSTGESSLPTTDKSYSSKDKVTRTGEIQTRRYYGEGGKAELDIDYTDHGNPKLHPKGVPPAKRRFTTLRGLEHKKGRISPR